MTDEIISSSLDTQKVILSLLLANGITTVINMLGSPEILSLREDLARGKLVGPKLYTTGIFVEADRAYSLGPLLQLPTFNTAKEVRGEVIAEKRAGYDFLKVHGELTEEAYRALPRLPTSEVCGSWAIRRVILGLMPYWTPTGADRARGRISILLLPVSSRLAH